MSAPKPKTRTTKPKSQTMAGVRLHAHPIQVAVANLMADRQLALPLKTDEEPTLRLRVEIDGSGVVVEAWPNRLRVIDPCNVMQGRKSARWRLDARVRAQFEAWLAALEKAGAGA